MNAFIQDAAGGDFIGRLRPGNVSFIDFFSSNSSKYWNLLLESQYNKIPFSGLWIDMNEYTSYCSGQCVFP
jgi:alpha-glucosidase